MPGHTVVCCVIGWVFLFSLFRYLAQLVPGFLLEIFMGIMLYRARVLLVLNIGIMWCVMFLLIYDLGRVFQHVRRLILGSLGKGTNPYVQLMYCFTHGMVDLTYVSI